jgi:hypothetical protein
MFESIRPHRFMMMMDWEAGLPPVEIADLVVVATGQSGRLKVREIYITL